MATEKCRIATEALNDSLGLTLDKALGLPLPGKHVGGGLHVAMPATWDGSGATPPGWTKRASINYVLNASQSAFLLPDWLGDLVTNSPYYAGLSGAEKGQLTAALAARVPFDLETPGYNPKQEAVSLKQA
jgi:hypothetical protein